MTLSIYKRTRTCIHTQEADAYTLRKRRAFCKCFLLAFEVEALVFVESSEFSPVDSTFQGYLVDLNVIFMCRFLKSSRQERL